MELCVIFFIFSWIRITFSKNPEENKKLTNFIFWQILYDFYYKVGKIFGYCKIPFFFSALGLGAPSIPLNAIIVSSSGAILTYNISLKYNFLSIQGLTSIFKLVRKSNPACCVFHVRLAKKSYTTRRIIITVITLNLCRINAFAFRKHILSFDHRLSLVYFRE